MFVFVLTLQLLCCSGIIAEHEEALPIASHFDPSELANLTSEEEHRLQLKALSSKNGTTIELQILTLEMYAMFQGNDFYSSIDNETVNAKTTAIFKALSDCLGNVQIQSRAYSVFFQVFLSWLLPHLSTHYEVSQALYNLSSEIDDKLKNETIYTTLRDEYIKSESWKSRKIFLYGIPKTEEELRATIAQLINDPRTKKFQMNVIYAKPSHNPENEGEFVRGLMLYLSNFPGKLKTAQKIYDETILDVVSSIPDIPASKTDLKATINLEGVYKVESSIIFKKLREKIATLIES